MQIANSYILLGKPVTKVEGAKVTKPSKPAPVKGASVKQAKTVDPKKDEEDDSDSDESDDELAGIDESESSDEVCWLPMLSIKVLCNLFLFEISRCIFLKSKSTVLKSKYTA